MEVTYANRYVYRVCTECEGIAELEDNHPAGALFGWRMEATGVIERSAEKASVSSTIRTYGSIDMRFEGLCPLCSCRVEWSFDVCENHDPGANENCAICGRKRAVLVSETCTVCKSAGEGPPGIEVLFHPAVVFFCYDHGLEVGFTGPSTFEDVLETLNLAHSFDEPVVSTDSLWIRISLTLDGHKLQLTLDGDELHLTLDENVDVVDVDDVRRSPRPRRYG